MRQVERADRQFGLVMLAERMEESLVLLSHFLCWDLNDVIVLKVNARTAEVNPKVFRPVDLVERKAIYMIMSCPVLSNGNLRSRFDWLT